MFTLGQQAGFWVQRSTGIVLPAANVSWDFCTDESLTDSILGETLTLTRINAAGTAKYWDVNGDLIGVNTDVARFNYDPLSHEPLGLLLGGQINNFQSRSEEIPTTSGGAWTNTNLTFNSNVTDFFGTGNVADRIRPTTVNGLHFCKGGNATIGVTGDQANGFVFAKRDVFNHIKFKLQAGSGSFFEFFVDLRDGTIGDTAGTATPYAYGVEEHPDGWWMPWIIAPSITSATCSISIYVAIGNSIGDDSFLPDDNIEGVYVCGAQLTNHALLSTGSNSNFIPMYNGPNVSGLVDMDEEVINIPTGAWFNNTEGTLFIDFYQTAQQNVYGYFACSLTGDPAVGTAAIWMRSNGSAGNSQGFINILGSDNFSSVISDTPAFQVAGRRRMAIAYKENDCQFALNGIAGVVDNTQLIPTVNTLRLNTLGLPTQFRGEANICRLAYWNTRLSEAELIELTALDPVLPLVPPAPIAFWDFENEQSLTDTTSTYTLTFEVDPALLNYWDASGNLVAQTTVDTPRWGYRPNAGVSTGLNTGYAIENDVINSEQVGLTTGGHWVLASMAAAQDNATVNDPRGNTSASRVFAALDAGPHYCETKNSTLIPVTTPHNVTISLFVAKYISGQGYGRYAAFEGDFGTNVCTFWWDLDDGSIGDTQGVMTEFGVEDVHADWWRVWISADNVTNDSVQLRHYSSSGTTNGDEVGVPAASNMYYWLFGGQMNRWRPNRGLDPYAGPITTDVTPSSEAATIATASLPSWDTTKSSFIAKIFRESYEVNSPARVWLVGGAGAASSAEMMYAETQIGGARFRIRTGAVDSILETTTGFDWTTYAGTSCAIGFTWVDGSHAYWCIAAADGFNVSGTLNGVPDSPADQAEIKLGTYVTETLSEGHFGFQGFKVWNTDLTLAELRLATIAEAAS